MNQTFTPDDLGRFLKQTLCDTSVHLNARSIKNKQDDLIALFDEIGPYINVVMLTETWYTDSSDHFILPGFHHFHVNRPHRRGGGVAMLIKNKTACEPIEMLCKATDDFEVLSVLTENTVFSVIYRPPNTNIAAFFEFLESTLSFVTENGYKCVIGGDINIDMLKHSSCVSSLSNLMASYNHYNVIDSPTRITSSSATLLDIFITNCTQEIISSGVITSDVSDHLPIYLSFSKKSVQYDTNKKEIAYQVVTEKELHAFRQDILETSWDFVFKKKSSSLAYSEFLIHFCNIYEKHFPFKTITPAKKSRKPWVTSKLLTMIRTDRKSVV